MNPVVAEPSATQEQKNEFFDVLAHVGSTSVAARELGLPRPRCVNWARKPGSSPSTQEWPNAPNTSGCARQASARMRGCRSDTPMPSLTRPPGLGVRGGSRRGSVYRVFLPEEE